MVKLKTVLNGVAISAISAGFLIGCGGGSSDDNNSDSSTVSADQTYTGPGSKWDVTLNDDSTFVITRRESASAPVTMTVNGNYVRHDTGFVSLTVSSSSGDGGPDAGDTAWALEVPGYAFLLKPTGDHSSQMIAMVSAGSCPTTDISANWVVVKNSDESDADSSERDFFGTFNFDVDSGTASLPSRYALADDFASQGANEQLPAGTCSDGLMAFEDAVMYLTSNGGALVHTGADDDDHSSIIFALSQSSISSMSTIDGHYAGMLFDDNMEDSGDKIHPVSMDCSNGTCTGTMVMNIETGATSNDSVTINLDASSIDSLGTGFVTGTIVSEEESGSLACMVDDNAAGSGSTIVSCVGQSPGDNSKIFNVMFVSH